jgi:hypothetical protein
LTEHRYRDSAYTEINVIIPEKKLPAPTPYELSQELDRLAEIYGRPSVRKGLSAGFLVGQIRDDLTRFLLKDLPFNNDRLEKKNELIPAPEPEVTAKPVLH